MRRTSAFVDSKLMKNFSAFARLPSTITGVGIAKWHQNLPDPRVIALGVGVENHKTSGPPESKTRECCPIADRTNLIIGERWPGDFIRTKLIDGLVSVTFLNKDTVARNP